MINCLVGFSGSTLFSQAIFRLSRIKDNEDFNILTEKLTREK